MDSFSPADWQACEQKSLSDASGANFFPGNSRMSRTVRQTDWSRTGLGPVAAWPECVRTAIRIALDSDFPLVVLCGTEFVYVYNDASIPIFGDKHPWALGRRAADVWSEAWATIGPMLDAVFATGTATRHDDLLLVLQRRGFVEECYFTFSYSPVRSEGNAVEGIFVAVLETTERVISERRLRTLGDLATQVSLGHGQENAFDLIAAALTRNPHDIPFAAVYLSAGDGQSAKLALRAGLADGADDTGDTPARIVLPAGERSDPGHPVGHALRTGRPQLFDAAIMPGAAHRCGGWPEPPRQALALPFRSPGQAQPRGVLVVGVNPRRSLDDGYHAFFDLVAGHIATAVASIEAARADRSRAEAMAELDRSKSAFFANASHELRTPVTLILGPLEEIIERDGQALPPSVRERLDMVHRNARRLHKLVNSIMDFASIEAGRLLIQREPTDVGLLTADVASLFRSTVESAGLAFSVQCPVPLQNVLIDREMWETVVLNLVCNAFKFTLEGRIDVVLQRGHDMLRLTVADTGTGIAHDDLPHIFERFYRGSSAGARSCDGSGIGLALVRELVRLHGGSIEVHSVPAQGATFSVRIPLEFAAADGNAPVTREHGAPSAIAGTMRQACFEEVRRLAAAPAQASVAGPAAQLAGQHGPAGHQAQESVPEPMRVLVIDDNEDVVRYIERLLAGVCTVSAAHDGVSGLAAIHRDFPDLVLMDVMMPGMSGFDLLRAVRADLAVQTISIIILSARAGEEARLEAIEAGADDYLVKPFNGRELIARVRSHIQMARVRRVAIEREGELLQQIAEVQHDLDRVLERTSDAFISLDRDLRIIALNDTVVQLLRMSRSEIAGLLFTEVSPGIKDSRLEQALRRAMELQQAVSVEHFHAPSARWFSVRCYPTPQGVIAFGVDITERKAAEEELRAAHADLERRVAVRTQELRELYDRLQGVREEERSALAREVHDQLGQILSAAKIDITLLEDDVRPAGAPLSRRKILGELRSARRSLDKAIDTVRQIATELRAPELEEQGLYAAIKWHARDFERRTRIKCSVMLPRDVREPKGLVATTLFRIFQEAMTNVLRHARAKQAWISLERRGGSVLLRVRDDGIGIPRKRARSSRSLGLTGMRERAALAAGRVVIGALRPCGTLVAARVPLAGDTVAPGAGK